MNSRRHFITKSAGAIAALCLSEQISFAHTLISKKVELFAGDTVLFQGNSITDWGRDRKQLGSNNTAALGTGYPLLAAAGLLSSNGSKNLQIFNRGIGGNKVFQLADR